MAKLERVPDIHGKKCDTCGEPLTALAARFDPIGRKDPVYVQEAGTSECPNGHEQPKDPAQ